MEQRNRLLFICSLRQPKMKFFNQSSIIKMKKILFLVSFVLFSIIAICQPTGCHSSDASFANALLSPKGFESGLSLCSIPDTTGDQAEHYSLHCMREFTGRYIDRLPITSGVGCVVDWRNNPAGIVNVSRHYR